MTKWQAATILFCSGLMILLSQFNFSSANGLRLEIADDGSERARGLSGRSELATEQGLLMIFEESAQHGIWMKDMQFAIDIIWMDKYKRVVSIVENAQPSSYPHTFRPSVPARYVLETNAGYVAENRITIGSQTNF